MNKSELINDSLIELNVEAQSKEEALKKSCRSCFESRMRKKCSSLLPWNDGKRKKTPQPGLAAELQSLMQKWKRWSSPLSA